LESLEVLWVQWWIPSLIPRTALIRVHYVFEDIVEEIATRIRQHQQQQHQILLQIRNESQSQTVEAGVVGSRVGAVGGPGRSLFDVDESLFIALNAPEFLFVSHNVAVHCPMTFESVLIRLYKTFLPGEQFSRKWKSRLDSSVRMPNVWQRVVSAVMSMSWASVMVPIYWCVALLPFAVHKILLRWVVMGVSGALALSWWYAVKDHDDMFVAVFVVSVFVLLLVLLFKYFSYSSDRFKGESSIPVGRPAAMFKVQASTPSSSRRRADVQTENRNEEGREVLNNDVEEFEEQRGSNAEVDGMLDLESAGMTVNNDRRVRKPHSDSEESEDLEHVQVRRLARKSQYCTTNPSVMMSKTNQDFAGQQQQQQKIVDKLEEHSEIEYFDEERDIQGNRSRFLSDGSSLNENAVTPFVRNRGKSSSFESSVVDVMHLQEEMLEFDIV
jgi:hypothetical protein